MDAEMIRKMNEQYKNTILEALKEETHPQEVIDELRQEIALLRSVLRETLPYLYGEGASLVEQKAMELLAKE